MADLTRPNFGEAWASEGEKLSPGEAKLKLGWVQEMMTYQYENYLQARQDEAILYLLQKGVPEYSATQEYTANKSVVVYQGNLYMATATVTGVLPTVTASWKRISPTVGANGAVSISSGGTGATTVAEARTNLGLGTASTVNLPTTNGVVVRSASNTLISRLLTGTSGNISVTNPDGVAGNINIDVGNNVAKLNTDSSWTSKGGITLPKGSSSERGVEVPGKIRYNTELQKFEGYNGTDWNVLGAASEVEITTLSGDGITASFTLTAPAFSETSTDAYIGGVWQNKGTYNVSGSTITFSEAPTPGTDNIQVVSRRVVDLGVANASQVSIQGTSNYYTATTVEGALREVGEDFAKLTSYSGNISADAEWSDVPAHSDPAFDVQTQALANRVEVFKLAPLQYTAYADILDAAPRLAVGQIVESLYDQMRYTIDEDQYPSYERPIVKENDYSKIRSYTGRATRLKVIDNTGAHWWVRRGSAADNGGTVLVDALGRSWEREYSGAVNVMWFGAAGDGLTDDTAAIQAAVDSLLNIYFPDGKYLITSTLISRKRGQGFYGGQGSIGGKADIPYPGYGAILQFAPVDNTQPLWIVRSSQVTFSGLKFRGKESERSKVCIKFQKLANTDDVDGYVYDCEFYHFTEPVHFYARALHADRNVFSSLGNGTAITFDWPDSGGEGGDIHIDDRYKGRSHRITNNRFHGSGVAVTIKNYTQRSPIYANNMMDTGYSFMRVAAGGGLDGAIIVGNTIDLCSASCVRFDALSVCRNTVFSANKIGGAIAGLVDGEDRRPFTAIAFDGVAELDGLLVANNTICATDAAAISIFNDAGSAEITAKNININGNLFDHIGLQGVDRSIFFTAFDIDNFVFSNNTIGSVGAGFVGLIRGSNRTISNPVIRGNSFDAAYPILFQTNLDGIIDVAASTSGVYAPALVNEVNVASSSSVSCQYMRVGDTVTVSGSISVTALATGDTSVGVSLPIASNFASNSDAGGVFVSNPMTSAAHIYGGIAANPATDQVRFRFNAINTNATSLSFNFTYRIR